MAQHKCNGFCGHYECLEHQDDCIRNIKPQLKESQYFYVWRNHKGEIRLFGDGLNELPIEYKYIGKIKLEVDE